jgi:hypothetical protein
MLACIEETVDAKTNLLRSSKPCDDIKKPRMYITTETERNHCHFRRRNFIPRTTERERDHTGYFRKNVMNFWWGNIFISMSRLALHIPCGWLMYHAV